MKKLVVAFHVSTVDRGDLRGALRAFRAVIQELTKREDIELVCLGERVSNRSDPVGAIYERIGTTAWLNSNAKLAHYLVARQSSVKYEVIYSRRTSRLRSAWHRLKHRWKKHVPEDVRRIVHPGVATAIRGITVVLEAFRVRRTAEIAPLDIPPPIDRMIDPISEPFHNRDIVGKVISLDQVDILINFWWFHSPQSNPLFGAYRPRNLRVLCWFLDAIPLRVAHWQPGMIPVEIFRAAVQHNLELADEIVTISRSAAEDISLFFPHIRKPVHIMPCGVFESDFIAPHGQERLRQELGVDLRDPLFCLIGAMEPSKNTLNTLKAVTSVARQIKKRIQVAIIGPMDDASFARLSGPYAERVSRQLKMIFVGHTTDEMKRAVLSNSTALLYASKWEGFGIPPLEAMAAQVPVVASDIPALREFCVGIATLCDPYDPDDIAAAILETMNMSPQEKAARLERARQKARQYSWSAAVDTLIKSISNPCVRSQQH